MNPSHAKVPGTAAARFWPHKPTHWIPSAGNVYDPAAFKRWRAMYPQEFRIHWRYCYLRRFKYRNKQVPEPYKVNKAMLAQCKAELKALTNP